MIEFVIRDAVDGDAARIAALMCELGYPTTDTASEIGVSGAYPILSTEPQNDASVWVRMSEDGVGGETATVRRTKSGWHVTKVALWVA